MTCHVRINENLTKDNNDMMQCVTCNTSPLFAPRQRKDKFSKCF